MLGMKKCIEALKEKGIKCALIDGNRVPETSVMSIPIVKGDSLSASIAAASVLAKVTRDRYMIELSEKYPQYHFEKHKGYPTKEHYEAIKLYDLFNEELRKYVNVETGIFGADMYITFTNCGPVTIMLER